MVFNIWWTKFPPSRFWWVIAVFNGRSRNLETQCHNKIWNIKTYTTYEHIYPLNSLWWFSTFHELILLLHDSYEFNGRSRNLEKQCHNKVWHIMSIFIPLIHFGDFQHFMNLFSSFMILMSSMEGHEISKRKVIIKFQILKHTTLRSIFIPLIHFSGSQHFMNLFS